jgi:hypothetical protein
MDEEMCENVSLCTFIEAYLSFGATYSFHFQCKKLERTACFARINIRL